MNCLIGENGDENRLKTNSNTTGENLKTGTGACEVFRRISDGMSKNQWVRCKSFILKFEFNVLLFISSKLEADQVHHKRIPLVQI